MSGAQWGDLEVGDGTLHVLELRGEEDHLGRIRVQVRRGDIVSEPEGDGETIGPAPVIGGGDKGVGWELSP